MGGADGVLAGRHPRRRQAPVERLAKHRQFAGRVCHREPVVRQLRDLERLIAMLA